MPAWLIVRAEVAEADRAAFDRWYGTEHLPDAKSAFGALSACRGWSDAGSGAERTVHLAVYEFADAASARRAVGSDAIKELIAEFDRVWGDRVARTREVVEVVQRL